MAKSSNQSIYRWSTNNFPDGKDTKPVDFQVNKKSIYRWQRNRTSRFPGYPITNFQVTKLKDFQMANRFQDQTIQFSGDQKNLFPCTKPIDFQVTKVTKPNISGWSNQSVAKWSNQYISRWKNWFIFRWQPDRLSVDKINRCPGKQTNQFPWPNHSQETKQIISRQWDKFHVVDFQVVFSDDRTRCPIQNG